MDLVECQARQELLVSLLPAQELAIKKKETE